MAFRKIDINELSRWSPWPARLLGLEEWKAGVRDVAKIDREYDKDKYGSYLARYRELGSRASPDVIREIEMTHLAGTDVAVTIGPDLVVGPWGETCGRYDAMLVDTLRPTIQQHGVAVELGCGWGFYLGKLAEVLPDARLLGFDYSENANALAREIFSAQKNITVGRFDYYSDRYDAVFDAVRANGFDRAVVYTSHSIEQLPSAAGVIRALRKHADQIATVFHFEPVFELHNDDLMGMLRRAYANANDYNRDLYGSLAQPDIRILRAEADVIGRVPFNATSVLQWEFAH